MLKSLIVVTTFLFAAAALARGQCRNVSEIHRNLNRVINLVELVPPDEANYIRAEKAKAADARGRGQLAIGSQLDGLPRH